MVKWFWGALLALPVAAAQETNINLQLAVEQISQKPQIYTWLLIAAFLIALASIGYYLYHLHQHRNRSISLRTKAKSQSPPTITLPEMPTVSLSPAPAKAVSQEFDLPTEVEKYLKEDERIVLRVLQMKGGSTSQGTLRVATNFSKAKLSRILSELEQRNVIHKDKEGKKNLVSLRF